MNIFLKIITIISFGFLIESCKKDDEPNLGCTDPTALNYNPNANEDDNSCIILGCTDSTSLNYNPDATDDNGSCEFSNSYLLNGEWNITNINYNVSDIDYSENFNDVGFWNFQYPENTYSSELNFPIPVPMDDSININTIGTWELSNNDSTLTITDGPTSDVSNFQIKEIRENTCRLEGQIQREFFFITYTVDVVMQLTKQ